MVVETSVVIPRISTRIPSRTFPRIFPPIVSSPRLHRVIDALRATATLITGGRHDQS